MVPLTCSADDERPRYYGAKIAKALAELEDVDPVPVDLSDFSTTDGTILYTVLPGDTLASLAQEFKCSQVTPIHVAPPCRSRPSLCVCLIGSQIWHLRARVFRKLKWAPVPPQN